MFMQKKFTTLASFFLLFFISLSAHSASSFSYISEYGDYIGWGSSNNIDETQASFNSSYFQNGTFVSLSGKKEFWDMILMPQMNKKIEIGTFTYSTEAPRETSPTLLVSGNGRACNKTKGEFKVLDVKYDRQHNVISLAVDFVQHCENFDPAFYGALRYRSSVPNDLNDYIASLKQKI